VGALGAAGAGETEMIADTWVAAAEVAMEAVASLFVSGHSGAAIAIVLVAMGRSVTYVFSFLA
jgi:hypothetical protein